MRYGPVSLDPEVLGGTAVFTGSRVPVQTLFDYIEAGERLEMFMDDFPSIKREDAIAVLEMAKRAVTIEDLLHAHRA